MTGRGEVAGPGGSGIDQRDRILMADQAGLLREELAGGNRELFPHPHTLRHTRAVELLNAGIPVTAVQDLLGHSSLLTTAQYLRLSGQDIENMLRGKGL